METIQEVPPLADPFGLGWGIALIAVAAGMFGLGLFLGNHSPIAATVCTALAVLAGPMGAVLLASETIWWGTTLIVALGVCLLLVLAVVLLIRQWRAWINYFSGAANTKTTDKLVERATKATGSPAPSAAPPSSSES